MAKPTPFDARVARRLAGEQDLVWVLRITHKHGCDVLVSRELGTAERILVEFCEDWWESVVEDTTMPKDKKKLVKEYFAHSDWEDYSLEQVEVLE